MERIIRKISFTLFVLSVIGQAYGNSESMIETGWKRLSEGIHAIAWKKTYQHKLDHGRNSPWRHYCSDAMHRLYRLRDTDAYLKDSTADIQLIEDTKGKDIGKCHDYTLKKLMEVDLETFVDRNPIGEKIENHFEIQPNPQPGYLCVYGNADLVNGKVKLSNIAHTGIVCQDGKTIESRYGEIIFRQHPSHAPSMYSDHVVYFKPPSPEQLRLDLGVSGWKGLASVAKIKQIFIDCAEYRPHDLFKKIDEYPYYRTLATASGIDVEALRINTNINDGLKGLSEVAERKQFIFNLARTAPRDLLNKMNNHEFYYIGLASAAGISEKSLRRTIEFDDGLKNLSALAEKISTSTLRERIAIKQGIANKIGEVVRTIGTGKLIAGTVILSAAAYGLYNWYNKTEK